MCGEPRVKVLVVGFPRGSILSRCDDGHTKRQQVAAEVGGDGVGRIMDTQQQQIEHAGQRLYGIAVFQSVVGSDN
jgi:hypothetical protein